MTADLVKANILMDTTSWTANQYFALYNLAGWTNSGQIPRYLYTCLADLCSGFIDSGNFSNLVVGDYGLAQTQATLGIIIQPTTIQDSVGAGWFEADQIPSEYGEFNILVKNVKTSIDINIIADIGYRLRYILDFKQRSLHSNQFMVANGLTSPDLTITGDASVDPNGYYKMAWKGSGILRVFQQDHSFCSEYIRNFNYDYGFEATPENY